MTDRPVHLSRYIMLTVQHALSKDERTEWRDCVEDHAPAGTVTTIQVMDEEGLKPVTMIHRSTKGGERYLVPLARDLTADEIDRIATAFAAEHPKTDFDIETQEERPVVPSDGRIRMDGDAHERLCLALAKQKHEDWMRERTDAGWRYGTSFSTRNKTHPLLRPWDQLPARFRKADSEWPQKLVDLLDANGYAVVARSDLERLLGLIKGSI